MITIPTFWFVILVVFASISALFALVILCLFAFLIISKISDGIEFALKGLKAKKEVRLEKTIEIWNDREFYRVKKRVFNKFLKKYQKKYPNHYIQRNRYYHWCYVYDCSLSTELDKMGLPLYTKECIIAAQFQSFGIINKPNGYYIWKEKYNEVL